MENNVVGQSIPRADAVEKVTGAAVYGEGLDFSKVLHAKVLRSPFAHAKIVNIDTQHARRLPGVKAITTGKDITALGGEALKDYSFLTADSDWVNLGVCRVQVHDEKTISVMISKGKQGAIIMQKYFDKGEPCPVAITFGQDILLYLVGGMEIPFGTSEYDVTGGIRGEAVEIVKGPKTGLPLPATAEIAIEGEIRKN